MYRRIEVLKCGALLLFARSLLCCWRPTGLRAIQSAAGEHQSAVIDRLLKRIDEMEASQQQMQAKIDQLSGAQAAAAAVAPAPVQRSRQLRSRNRWSLLWRKNRKIPPIVWDQ